MMDGYIIDVGERFGFIRALGYERDVFLHPSEWKAPWGEHLIGLPVTFTLEDNNGRLKAINVRPA
jgi:cold shock CspA family protein